MMNLYRGMLMISVTNFHQHNDLKITSLVKVTWYNLNQTYTYLTTHYGDEGVPDIWTEHLSPLFREDIDRGWPRMLKEHPSNPPTAMEFVLLCKVRPEDEGYPSPEEAYQQAMGNNPNKHPIVSLTCREMGTRASDMRQMLDNQARKLFVGFYLDIADKVIEGHLELPKAISEDEYVKSEQDSVNRRAFKDWFAREFLVGI